MALKIYIHEHGSVEIQKALKLLTDDFIFDGNTCHQTILDMRNCLKKLLKKDPSQHMHEDIIQ